MSGTSGVVLCTICKSVKTLTAKLKVVSTTEPSFPRRVEHQSTGSKYFAANARMHPEPVTTELWVGLWGKQLGTGKLSRALPFGIHRAFARIHPWMNITQRKRTFSPTLYPPTFNTMTCHYIFTLSSKQNKNGPSPWDFLILPRSESINSSLGLQ